MPERILISAAVPPQYLSLVEQANYESWPDDEYRVRAVYPDGRTSKWFSIFQGNEITWEQLKPKDTTDNRVCPTCGTNITEEFQGVCPYCSIIKTTDT